jgi:Ni,Fe-hydrogenase I large subunit
LTGTGTDHEVDPISRIEGHLGVKVRVDAGGHIIDANAHGNLWRGFENFLLGRDINDAITFVQRICGVCPVPHGMTSTYCVDNVLGYSKGHITFADDGSYVFPRRQCSSATSCSASSS